jgi:hypothetical protein
MEGRILIFNFKIIIYLCRVSKLLLILIRLSCIYWYRIIMIHFHWFLLLLIIIQIPLLLVISFISTSSFEITTHLLILHIYVYRMYQIYDIYNSRTIQQIHGHIQIHWHMQKKRIYTNTHIHTYLYILIKKTPAVWCWWTQEGGVILVMPTGGTR